MATLFKPNAILTRPVRDVEPEAPEIKPETTGDETPPKTPDTPEIKPEAPAKK